MRCSRVSVFAKYVVLTPLAQVILYLEDRDDNSLPSWHPYVVGAAVIVTQLAEAIFFRHSTQGVLGIAAQMRACLTQAVYSKALRLSASSAGRADATAGEIVNLVSSDCRRLLDGALFTNMVIASPILVTFTLVALVSLLGAAPTFAGLAVYIILVPTNSVFSRKMMRSRRAQMKHMDHRVKVTNEVLQGVLAIKLFVGSTADALATAATNPVCMNVSVSVCVCVCVLVCMCVTVCQGLGGKSPSSGRSKRRERWSSSG